MATNPHIYVSSVVGTNTGASDTSKATQQTGNITSMTASDVYTSLKAAYLGCSTLDATTIYVTDDHSYNDSLGTAVPLDGGKTTGLNIISVDSTAIDTPKVGATELNTSTAEWLLRGNVYLYGMDMEGTDDTFHIDQSESNITFDSCIIRISGSADYGFRILSDGSLLTILNSEIVFGTSSLYAASDANTIHIWRNVTLSGSVPVNLFGIYGTTGGIQHYLDGCDLSLLTSQSLVRIPTTSGVTDNTITRLTNCKLNASFSMPVALTDLVSVNHRYEQFNCDDTTGGDLTRFYIANGAGSARNNNSVYNSNNPAYFEGTTKSSIEIRTTSICSIPTSFIFEIPAEYVDLSDTATDKIIVNLVTNITLTHSDIRVSFVYPDGTTAVQPNYIDSGFTPLNGATLSTSSLGAADWTGEPASPNFYKLELDTSTDAGQAFAPRVQIEVFKASIDGTTNKLFIDPVLEIGT